MSGLLDQGIQSQGAVTKSFDKYGKRIYVATPKKDMSLKDAKHPAKSVESFKSVASDQTRVDNGTK